MIGAWTNLWKGKTMDGNLLIVLSGGLVATGYIGYVIGEWRGRKIERLALSKQWANSLKKSTPAGG